MQRILKKFIRIFSNLSLPVLSFIGVILGISYGLIIRQYDMPIDFILIIEFPGKVFFNSLKLLIIPLLSVMMIRVPLDIGEMSKAKKIGARVIVYYLITTLIASLVGLAFYNIIKPGTNSIICSVDSITEKIQKIDKNTSALSSILKIGTTAITSNIFEAFVESNILAIILFFLCFGFGMLQYINTNGGKSMRYIVDTIYVILMEIMKVVIFFTPVGVLSLISTEISKLRNTCIFVQLGIYLGTYLAAILFHVIFVYSMIYFLFTRKNPFLYYKNYFESVVTSFATASSAAALSLTLKGAEKSGINTDIANFVLPLGATINMDGTAIYYPITVLFLTSLQGETLSFARQLVVAMCSSVIAMGSAPVPSGGLVFLVLVLNGAGIPIPNQISYIWALDFFLDRCNTTTNILGDSVAVGVINKMCSNKPMLKSEDETKSSGSVRKLSVSTMDRAEKLLEKSKVMMPHE